MSLITSSRIGARMDITTRRGADFHRRYHAQVVSGDTYVDFGLDGYTGATIQVRRKPNTPITELTFSTSDGSIILGSEGRFDLVLSYDTMDKIRAGEYHYDMYLSNSTYPKRDFLYGKFIIEDKITA